MDRLQKLPIGIQTFDKLREEGYLYVDKTKYLIDLIDRGKAYFLSRPRRFGKSLTVSTLEAIFSGKRELFKGLAAEEFFERPDYRTHPVLRIDLSQVLTGNGVDGVRESMTKITKERAEECGIDIRDATESSEALRLFIRRLYAERGSMAVLIDEYDKPILDFFHEPEKALEVRSILRDFYIQIKAEDASIRFVLLTGISKFSKMGVFSAMNNLRDISMTDDYATMLGYTEEELLANFGEHIDAVALDMKISREELISKIRDYYDGFSFNGEYRLYNPFSTLCFLSDRKFGNYWFNSGTPSFIARYMRDRKLTVEQFRGYEVSRDFAFAPGEIETSTAASFLYQSGYLSLRPGVLDDFSLDYPNHEVLTAMSSLLIGNIFGDGAELNDANERQITAIESEKKTAI
ncbi:ATPase AAA [Synergistales bacterium]|nr:ATPase AAA [Synergistales bacterium]